jgi:starvation-inducible DNA-binding protein
VEAKSRRDQQMSEEMIDSTLADSFPASDPPSWTLGRERYRKEPITPMTEWPRSDNKEKFSLKRVIDLEERNIDMVKILNTLLLIEYLLYTKTRNYHWNVTGPQLRDLHKLFQEQYIELSEIVDQIAERGRSLDGWAFGTMSEFSQHAKLTEPSDHYPEPCEMIADLLDDHEAVIRQLRGDLETCAVKYRDMGTNDFLAGLMEQHETMSWMLRAFLSQFSPCDSGKLEKYGTHPSKLVSYMKR